jgi:hypothetical protein
MAGQFDYPYQSIRINRLYSTKALNNNSYVIANDAFFEASATPNAIVYPSGVSVSSQIGTVTAKGSAKASPSGRQVSSQIGTATAYGSTVLNGLTVPSGVSVTSQNGDVVVSGGATATGTTDALSIVGNPAVVSGDGYVIVDGDEVYRLIGQPTALGSAICYISGVSVLSDVGVIASSGSAYIQLTGVDVSSDSGNSIGIGSAIVSIDGVSASSGVGTPTIVATGSVDAIAYPSGLNVYSMVGSIINTGDAIVITSGVSTLSEVGIPIALQYRRHIDIAVGNHSILTLAKTGKELPFTVSNRVQLQIDKSNKGLIWSKAQHTMLNLTLVSA